MTIAFILVGALPATLLLISKFRLGTPPRSHLLIEAVPAKSVRSSREDVRLAA